MTDNKIGPNIRPVGETRTNQQPAGKRPASDAGFDKLLENAKSELASAQSQGAAQPAPNDASALKAAAAAEQERFESVMRARQQISQAYLDITHKPTQDKS